MMKIIENDILFGDKEHDFVVELIDTIKNALEKSPLDNETIYQLTDILTYQITTLLDGYVDCGTEENPTVPFLAYLEAIKEQINPNLAKYLVFLPNFPIKSPSTPPESWLSKLLQWQPPFLHFELPRKTLWHHGKPHATV